MSLMLKSFSQDVDMDDPQKVLYFLVFRRDGDGEELRLQVQKETTEKLVDFLYGATKVSAAMPSVEAFQRQAMEDTMDEHDKGFLSQLNSDGEIEEEEEATYYGDPPDDTPGSEDEIPSL